VTRAPDIAESARADLGFCKAKASLAFPLKGGNQRSRAVGVGGVGGEQALKIQNGFPYKGTNFDYFKWEGRTREWGNVPKGMPVKKDTWLDWRGGLKHRGKIGNPGGEVGWESKVAGYLLQVTGPPCRLKQKNDRNKKGMGEGGEKRESAGERVDSTHSTKPWGLVTRDGLGESS